MIGTAKLPIWPTFCSGHYLFVFGHCVTEKMRSSNYVFYHSRNMWPDSVFVKCLEIVSIKHETPHFEYRIYSMVSRAYKVFFIISCGLQSRASYNRGRLTFFSLAYQNV